MKGVHAAESIPFWYPNHGYSWQCLPLCVPEGRSHTEAILQHKHLLDTQSAGDEVLVLVGSTACHLDDLVTHELTGVHQIGQDEVQAALYVFCFKLDEMKSNHCLFLL